MPDMPDDVPLYAAPALPPRVRSLQFELKGEGLEATYIAPSMVGKFAVWQSRQGNFVLQGPPDYGRTDAGSSLEEAFALANSHFSGLVLSALA